MRFNFVHIGSMRRNSSDIIIVLSYRQSWLFPMSTRWSPASACLHLLLHFARSSTSLVQDHWRVRHFWWRQTHTSWVKEKAHTVRQNCHKFLNPVWFSTFLYDMSHTLLLSHKWDMFGALLKINNTLQTNILFLTIYQHVIYWSNKQLFFSNWQTCLDLHFLFFIQWIICTFAH